MTVSREIWHEGRYRVREVTFDSRWPKWGTVYVVARDLGGGITAETPGYYRRKDGAIRAARRQSRGE